jgi:hypothetical protein
VPKGQYPITFVGQYGSHTTTFNLTLIIQDGNYWLDSPNPGTLTLRMGSTGAVTVMSGFGYPGQTPNYKLKLSVSGLPGGTTASFPDTIVPGKTATVSITAAANAPVSHNSVLVTATPTDGGFIYSTNFTLNVIPQSGQLATSRSDLVPTDGDIVSAVYDPVHQVVFGSNPMWNRVEVISPATRAIVTSIQIPSPQKLEMSLDGAKVLVGTNTSQAYWIDTTSMQVVARQKFPIPSRASIPELHELSTGEIFVVSYLNYSRTALVCARDASTCRSVQPTGMGLPDYFLVSANGTKALLASDGSPGYVTVYDAATGALQNSAQLRVLAIDPTGTYCVIMDGGNGSGVSLYDMQLVQQRNLLPSGEIFGIPQGLFSSDGKTIYLVATAQSSNGAASTYTIDVASGAQLGVAPTLGSWSRGNYTAEVPYAVDRSGLIFGGYSHALAIDDSTFYNNVPLGSGFIPWLTVNSGPVNATTQVSFGGTSYDYTPDVYFGGVFAPSSLSGGTLTSTVPARSTPGPVNIKMEFSNGTEGFQPWAFTYGPWLQVADGSGSGSAGGATASVVGLGLGSDPAKVQVSVGGETAQVIGVNSYIASAGLSSVYPFPSNAVTYVVPPGVPGVADISVTTSAGTATIKSGMRYSQIEDYPSSDTFSAMLYDRWRNRLYLTAGDHIDVFSLTSNSFVSPILPPSVNGKSAFAGMSLTPDGSKLLIANATDGSLSIVNPDSPSSATALLVAAPQVNGSCVLGPLKVAATNDNRALVAVGALPTGCNAGSSVYSVNLVTGVTSTLPTTCGIGDVFASRDGSKVVLSTPPNPPCLYDVAANTFVTFGSNYATTTAISGDGTLAAAPQYSSQWDIADLTGSTIVHSSLPDLLPANVTLNAAAMNDSGSLMYLGNGTANATGGGKTSSFVDVIDVNHGAVRSRIRLAENIQSVLTPMAVDPTDAHVFLITDKGLTVITLSGVPLSVGTINPISGGAGTLVTIRGSGFQIGMTATFNGAAANVVVVDSQTAQVTVPTVSSGITKLTLTNPDSQSYSLEAAFSVN